VDDHIDTDPRSLDDWTQPGVILPAQFHPEVRALRDPERRLRLAVLENAIRYFQRYFDSTHPRERVLYEDAVDWFASPDQTEAFSFENVCDALHLDPDSIRQRLCLWRAAGSHPARRSAPGSVPGRHLRAA